MENSGYMRNEITEHLAERIDAIEYGVSAGLKMDERNKRITRHAAGLFEALKEVVTEWDASKKPNTCGIAFAKLMIQRIEQ